jgi:hypothetical protein
MLAIVGLSVVGLLIGVTTMPEGVVNNFPAPAAPPAAEAPSITVNVHAGAAGDAPVAPSPDAPATHLNLELPYGAGMWSRMYPSYPQPTGKATAVLDVKPIGGTSAHICEASDAYGRGA